MSAIPITVTGTIATEPTARTLPSGRACSSFRLAVNHWRVDKATGEFFNDGTSWFGVDCYGDLARNATMSLRKGAAVIVTGTLRNREWATEERSGIAPTVIAEHIGPDLRFGTANYQRAKGAERAESPAPKPAGGAETSGSSAWGDFAAPSSETSAAAADDDSTASGTVSDALGVADDALDAAGDALSADDDALGTADDALDAGDDAPGTADDALGVDGDALGSDEAIAAETAKAAAPF